MTRGAKRANRSAPSWQGVGAGAGAPGEMAFLQAVIEAIPGTFFVLDNDGQFVRWNRATEELLAVPDESMPHKNILEAIAQQDRDAMARMLQRSLADGHAEAEVRLAQGSHATQWCYFVARRVDIQGKGYLVGTGTDVTERHQLEQKLEHQARTDFLTGVPNRRHFLELAEQEFARAHRYGRPFSVLMLDLDLFKSVNDRYGHRVGDLALQKLVEVCAQVLREVDVVGRLGGEEFGILLPETDAAQARQVADRLRVAVSAARVHQPDGGPVQITTSVGVATFRGVDSEFDAVLSRADRALYAAKRAGRDCVGTESDVPST